MSAPRRTRLRLLTLALACALASPASAHLLSRGIPLSELSISSPLALQGRVASFVREGEKREITLAVERAVIGSLDAEEPVRIALEGHHTPDYEVGSRVIVFLKAAAPPFVSRQTALDRLDVPASPAERDALLATLRAYAALRAVPERAALVAQLRTLGLSNLDSASERARREALLDLVSLAAGGTPFGANEVERVAAIAKRPDPHSEFAPALVVLLATLRTPTADAALVALAENAANAHTRARAVQVIGRRGAANAVALLRGALGDPARVVRLTAEQELRKIDSPAARTALREHAAAGSPESDPDSMERES